MLCGVLGNKKVLEERNNMKEEWNAKEELKLYLNDILSLRPAKNLSPLSFFIFKLGKELLDNIGEEAGHMGDLSVTCLLFMN